MITSTHSEFSNRSDLDISVLHRLGLSPRGRYTTNAVLQQYLIIKEEPSTKEVKSLKVTKNISQHKMFFNMLIDMKEKSQKNLKINNKDSSKEPDKEENSEENLSEDLCKKTENNEEGEAALVPMTRESRLKPSDLFIGSKIYFPDKNNLGQENNESLKSIEEVKKESFQKSSSIYSLTSFFGEKSENFKEVQKQSLSCPESFIALENQIKACKTKFNHLSELLQRLDEENKKGFTLKISKNREFAFFKTKKKKSISFKACSEIFSFFREAKRLKIIQSSNDESFLVCLMDKISKNPCFQSFLNKKNAYLLHFNTNTKKKWLNLYLTAINGDLKAYVIELNNFLKNYFRELQHIIAFCGLLQKKNIEKYLKENAKDVDINNEKAIQSWLNSQDKHALEKLCKDLFLDDLFMNSEKEDRCTCLYKVIKPPFSSVIVYDEFSFQKIEDLLNIVNKAKNNYMETIHSISINGVRNHIKSLPNSEKKTKLLNNYTKYIYSECLAEILPCSEMCKAEEIFTMTFNKLFIYFFKLADEVEWVLNEKIEGSVKETTDKTLKQKIDRKFKDHHINAESASADWHILKFTVGKLYECICETIERSEKDNKDNFIECYGNVNANLGRVVN